MSLVRPNIKFVRSISWIDICLFSILFLFIYALVGVAAEWTGPFRSKTEIDLSYAALPRYTFLSLFRGFVAYFFSLAFTIVYGYFAAHSRLAEKILIPLLDILQSVPVLGFLPGVVLALVSAFPNSNVGLELACVLMIFTGQVWNMTFSFYASVKGVPSEIREMTMLYRLRAFEVLKKVEVPYAMNGLLWNSMLSMAGGWFFLMVVESFRLGQQDFRLPGIGSYMAVAIENGATGPVIAGIVAMILVIVLVDRCLWAPLVYLSERFRTETRPNVSEPLVLRWLEKSQLLRAYYGVVERVYRVRESRVRRPASAVSNSTWRQYAIKGGYLLAVVVGLLSISLGGYQLYNLLLETSWSQWLRHLVDTVYTFLRVSGAVLLGTLWTVPVGVFIGSNAKWTRRLQPVVQVVAAFPAPMVFPILTYLFLSVGISFEYGCTLLMLVASQFYILFNVISGATVIPKSLKEVAEIYHLKGFAYWKNIVIPAIFPSLVNGWITASGGAWNASIVSEFVNFGSEELVATGIGASITRAAQEADFAALAGGIVMMVGFLILVNRVLWRRLYELAETRFRLEAG